MISIYRGSFLQKSTLFLIMTCCFMICGKPDTVDTNCTIFITHHNSKFAIGLEITLRSYIFKSIRKQTNYFNISLLLIRKSYLPFIVMCSKKNNYNGPTRAGPFYEIRIWEAYAFLRDECINWVYYIYIF